MKLAFSVLIALISAGGSGAHANEALILFQDLQTHDFGYTGKWVNQRGALSPSSLFVKLKREVTALSDTEVRVVVSYPAIPPDVLASDRQEQIGQPFHCHLQPDNTHAFAVEKIEQLQHSFRDLTPGKETFDILQGNTSDDKICVATLKILDPSVRASLNSLNWTSILPSGLPSIRVREQVQYQKSFAEVAKPYLEFLQEDDVTLRTDDEFWFLAAASVYSEPELAGNFLNNSPQYVKNWIKNLALYVAENSPKYKSSIEAKIGDIPDVIDTTYPADSLSEEVTYEF